MEVTAERMTLEEMQRAYPKKWVVFDEVERDPQHLEKWRVARPRAAAESRDEAWNLIATLDIRDGGVYFMGPTDPDLIFIF